MFDRVAVCVVTACALLVLTTSGLLLALGAQERDTYALALECRGALWTRAFDEATAAGLNPGAIAIDFTAGKAERRDAGGEVILTGTRLVRGSQAQVKVRGVGGCGAPRRSSSGMAVPPSSSTTHAETRCP